MSHVLLVEDDEELGRTLKEQLEDSQFSVNWCRSMAEFQGVKASDFTIAIVDLNLPDGNGFQVLKSLTLPVVIMTALNTPENRLKGLELGAVDFIPKPFLFQELKIKIERLLDISIDRPISVNRKTINFVARNIQSENGDVVFLSDREFNILKLIFERAPAAVSRDDILDFVSRQDEQASHRAIDNSLVKIRQYLGDKEQKIIKSVRGIGYQWIGENNES